ncbi:MAG TPA: hypothetical protein VF810_01925 [Patescibacteria group bacterium]
MLIEIIGWIGTISILLAYFLVSIKKLNANSKEFQLLNLFGSLGIIVNTWYHKAIPSVVLNAVWLLIAIYALLKTARK